MVSAIITAAGNGIRFGGNKMLAKINGETVFERTVFQFVKSKKIDEIIIAYKKENLEIYKKIVKKFKKKIIFVLGGKERINSTYNALKKAEGEIVVTHDGVRPFIPVWLIEKVIEGAKKYGAAISAVNPATTVKTGKDFVCQSLLRKETWLAQTPQAFKRGILLKAYKNALEKKYFIPTDDAEIVGLIGQKVKIVEGVTFNMKITYPEDLAIANKLFEFIKDKL